MFGEQWLGNSEVALTLVAEKILMSHMIWVILWYPIKVWESFWSRRCLWQILLAEKLFPFQHLFWKLFLKLLKQKYQQFYLFYLLWVVSLASLPLVKQIFWKTDGHGTYLFTGSKFISPMLEFLFERFIQWFQFFSFGLNQKSPLFILNLLQLTKLNIYFHSVWETEFSMHFRSILYSLDVCFTLLTQFLCLTFMFLLLT